MKILKIGKYKVKIDTKDFNKVKDLKLRTAKYRNKISFVFYENLQYHAITTLFLGLDRKTRIAFINKDFCDLRRSNIKVYKYSNEKERKAARALTAKKWNEKNKVEQLKKAKDYYHKNRESILEYNKEYLRKNKKKVKKSRTSLVLRHKRAKREAKLRGLVFTITFDNYQMLLNNGCYYCQKELLSETGSCLDRKNNSYTLAFGYRFKNVLPACGRCNKSRGHYWTVEQFKTMVDSLKI